MELPKHHDTEYNRSGATSIPSDPNDPYRYYRWDEEKVVRAIEEFKVALQERVNKPYNTMQIFSFSKKLTPEQQQVIDSVKNIDTFKKGPTYADTKAIVADLKIQFLKALKAGKTAFEGSNFDRIKRLFIGGKNSLDISIVYGLPDYIVEASNLQAGGRRRKIKTRGRRHRRRHTRK
jgi:hypothetical protein